MEPTSHHPNSELYRAIFEGASDGIFISDAQGRFLEVNQPGCEMLGYSPEDLRQLAWPEVLPAAEVAQELLVLHQTATGQTMLRECQLRGRGGCSFWSEIKAKRLADNRLVAWVCDIGERKQVEERLVYQAGLLSRVHDVVLATDEKFRITYWNQAAEEIFAWTEAEAIGRHNAELFQTQIPNSSREEVVKQLQEVGHYEGEAVFMTRRGRTIVGHVNAAALHGPQGEFAGVVISIRDNTTRRQAEEALHLSEQKFATAFLASPDAININRLSDGLFVEINEGFTTLTGYTREDVGGRTSLDLNIWDNPADRVQLTDGLQKQGQVNNLEARFRVKDGTLRTGLMSARLIEVGGEMCILSITRDITKQKQAQLALQESEERFRLFMDNSPTIAWIKGEQRRYVYLSRTHEHLLSQRKESWLGKTDFELWPPEMAEQFWRNEKEFSLTVDSHSPERVVTEADPIVVKFRQVTEATNLRRQEYLSRPIKRLWEKDGDGAAEPQYREEFQLTPFGKRMAVDVYLSMTSCNITDEAGRPLFTGKERTFEEFLARWGRLWPEWAETIYGACLKVNLDWGFGSQDENEDEETLTLGEDDAGVAAS